jgi:hypothetical protein
MDAKSISLAFSSIFSLAQGIDLASILREVSQIKNFLRLSHIYESSESVNLLKQKTEF